LSALDLSQAVCFQERAAMLSKKRTVALLFILSSIVLMMLIQISPHWTAARASYLVTVTSKEELGNVTVSAQTYGSFNTSAYSFENRTANANYVVTTQSGKLAGTNTTVTTLTVFIRWLRAGGAVNVTFPLVPLELKDVNFNVSFPIFPSVQARQPDQINRISKIMTRVTIQSDSGFLLYSYSDVATVSGGRIEWDIFPEEKNLSVFSLQLAFAMVSYLAVAIVLLPLSAWLRRSFPYVTVLASAAMMGIYALMGTGDDLLYRLRFNQTSEVLRLLLSPLFHASFEHVAGNIFSGFLINGFLIEVWLRRKIGKLVYVWFAVGYLLSVLFSYFTCFLVYGISGVGASLWIIALSVVLLEYLRRGSIKLGQRGLLMGLLAGFAIIRASYSYIVEAVVFYHNQYSQKIGISHLLFLVVALLVVHVTLRISEKRAMISRLVKKCLGRSQRRSSRLVPTRSYAVSPRRHETTKARFCRLAHSSFC